MIRKLGRDLVAIFVLKDNPPFLGNKHIFGICMKVFLIILAIVIVGIILLLLYFGLMAFGFSLAAKKPSPRDLKRAIRHVLGNDIGEEFEVLSLDYRFAHSDRPTSAIIKVPENKFQELVDLCRESADEETEACLIFRKTYDVESHQNVILDKINKTIHYNSIGCL